MLKITKEQMEMFEGLALERFKKTLNKDLRELYPEETKLMKDLFLDAIIDRGFDKCSMYKLTSQYDTRRYIEFSIEHGEDFDQDAWIQSTLTNDDLEASDKIDKIEEKLMFSTDNSGN